MTTIANVKETLHSVPELYHSHETIFKVVSVLGALAVAGYVCNHSIRRFTNGFIIAYLLLIKSILNVPSTVANNMNPIGFSVGSEPQASAAFTKKMNLYGAMCTGGGLIGGAVGGPFGMVIGGLLGALSAYRMSFWEHDPTVGAAIRSSHDLIIRITINFFKTATVTAAFSFICFVLGGHTDMAIGGLIGELIAYFTEDWRASHPLLNYTKSIVVAIAAVLIPILAYSRSNWKKAYKKSALIVHATSLVMKTAYHKVVSVLCTSIWSIESGVVKNRKYLITALYIVIAVNVIWFIMFLLCKHMGFYLQKLRQMRDYSTRLISSTVSSTVSSTRRSIYGHVHTIQHNIDRIDTTSFYQKVLTTIRELIEKINSLEIAEKVKSMVNQYTMEHNMCTPEFINNALICVGLCTLGYLFGDFGGFVIGMILSYIIIKGYSMCPRGSSPVIDCIMDRMGIEQNQTHWLNIFGTVYKLELPNENIESIQQWEQHKKTEVFKSFLAFVLEDLKYKVSGLNVSLVKRPEQNRILEPLITNEFKRIESHPDVVFGGVSNASNDDGNSGAVQPFVSPNTEGIDSNSNGVSDEQTNGFLKKMSKNEFDDTLSRRLEEQQSNEKIEYTN